MKLNELLKNVEVLNLIGDDEVEIKGVNIDSRRIKADHLFIAVPGNDTDIDITVILLFPRSQRFCPELLIRYFTIR